MDTSPVISSVFVRCLDQSSFGLDPAFPVSKGKEKGRNEREIDDDDCYNSHRI